MATARETLFDEIMALAGGDTGDALDATVAKIMLRYRVQTKPGVQTPDGVTARDALADRLKSLIRAAPADIADTLGSTIDEFRMQSKGKASSSPAKKKEAAKPRASKPSPPPPMPRTAPSRDDDDDIHVSRPRGAEPVAGGPRRRGKSRSECPKCHSMGVVLARSYAGDEYFSCIYCGWQAYKPADDSDPMASLASRLLGQGGGNES